MHIKKESLLRYSTFPLVFIFIAVQKGFRERRVLAPLLNRGGGGTQKFSVDRGDPGLLIGSTLL